MSLSTTRVYNKGFGNRRHQIKIHLKNLYFSELRVNLWTADDREGGCEVTRKLFQ